MFSRDRLRRPRGIGRDAAGLLVLGAVMGVFTLAAMAAPKADRTADSAPPRFLSGAERSLAILNDIKEVLVRIDTRLERMDGRLSEIDRRLGQMDEKLARWQPQQTPSPRGSGAGEDLRGRHQ
jgi:hypothetical protein